jgi:gliding motility-associated-like protein
MRRLQHLWLAVILLIALTSATAQTGLYDARFSMKNYDCGNKIATIQLQVRAIDVNHKFNMGDANYRFEYDPRSIDHPRITAQPNFSNQSPDRDMNYGMQNLNGTSKGDTRGLVSVNTFYTGSANGAKQVDTAWTTVSEIAFDVINTEGCFDLLWHNDKTFPVSGMSEVVVTNRSTSSFAYDLSVAKSSTNWGNVQACFREACTQNALPYVNVAQIVTPEDSAKTVCMIIQDANITNNHRATLCNNPRNGSATLTLNTTTRELCVTYNPNRDFNGRDSICINVCNIRPDSLCRTVTVPITVVPRPDAPVINPTLIVVAQDSTYKDCFTINDPDVGDTHNVTICGAAKNGVAQASINNGEVCIHYKPNAHFTGTDSVCLTICDNTGLCTSKTWVIRVLTCADTLAPVLACPAQPIRVTAFGEIVNNPLNFLTSATVNDNCSGVKLTFNTPKATDNCTANPSVYLTNGNVSGTIFTAGTYALRFSAKDSAGLISTCNVQIMVSPRPTRFITATDSLKICQNDLINVSTTLVNSATYQWRYPNGFGMAASQFTTPSTTLGKSDWLTLTTTVGNCSFKDSVYISITGQPIAVNDNYETERTLTDKILANDTLQRGLRTTVTLVSDVKKGTLSLNSNGNFTYNPANDAPYTTSFSYKVCYDACPISCHTAIANIKVISNQRNQPTATNVISPNGDGVNETLVILGFDANATDNASSIVIYNQWGDIVYRAAPYRNEWDGVFKDKPLPDGTYYYIFKRSPTAAPLKNFVTIIR